MPRNGSFVPTDLPRGPWDPRSQHAGPPAGLVVTELERRHPRGDAQLARMTFEILRPVPLTPLAIETRVARPGRKVELLEARMTADGNEVMRVSAWRMRTAEVALPEGTTRPDPPPPGPDQGRDRGFFPVDYVGYHTAMETRFVTGAFTEPGPAVVWMRMRVPLLPDEEPTPTARVVVAADSGNGVSGTLDYREWMFINTELSVALYRPPAGEWVCLDAETAIGPRGIGLARSTIADELGAIGAAQQSLLIDRR